MRGLQTTDIFKALSIINNAGIKNEIENMSIRVSNGEKLDVRKVGVEFIFNVLGNCPKVEQQLYEFIGGLLEIDSKEIATMEPLRLIEKIKELESVIPVEEWKSFFRSLSALITK